MQSANNFSKILLVPAGPNQGNKFKLMNLSKKNFQRALQDDRLDVVLKECVKPLETASSTQYTRYLTQMINSIHDMLKDGKTQPAVKNKLMELLTQLMLLGQFQICDLIERNILPILKGVCLVDCHLPIAKRGINIFNNIQEADQRMIMEANGIQFYRRCLESILVWSVWIPQSISKPTESSLFIKTYKTLVSEGVTFPAESQLYYYRNDVIEDYERKLNEMEKINESVPNVMASNWLPVMASVSSQNATQFWKNQNKHLKENQRELLEKIERLEMEVARLTKQVINRDKKLASYEFSSPNPKNFSTEGSTPRLRNTSSPMVSQWRMESLKLLPSFEQRFKKLVSQDKFRLKKAILREKYTVFKNHDIQLGCLIEYINPDDCRITAYFRNTCSQSIQLQCCDWQSELKVTQNGKFPLKIDVAKQVKVAQQLKMSYSYQLLGELFLDFTYKKQDKTVEIKEVTLPLSCFKLARPQNYDPKASFNEKYSKIIKTNPTMSGELEHLKETYPQAKMSVHEGKPELSLLLDLYDTRMMLMLFRISTNHMKLQVIFNTGGQAAATAILKEMQFLFS